MAEFKKGDKVKIIQPKKSPPVNFPINRWKPEIVGEIGVVASRSYNASAERLGDWYKVDTEEYGKVTLHKTEIKRFTGRIKPKKNRMQEWLNESR